MRTFRMNLFNQPTTNRIGGLEYGPGHVYPFGATIIGNSVNFSVFSKEATACTLVLYNHGRGNPSWRSRLPSPSASETSTP